RHESESKYYARPPCRGWRSQRGIRGTRGDGVVPAEHPWLAAILDLAVRPMYPARRLVVPLASGEGREIGVGTGLTLALYDASRVRRVTAIDPDPHMVRRARERAAVAPVPVDLIQAAAERIPCADGRFDTVLVTWTLCTVENPGATLAEVR